MPHGVDLAQFDTRDFGQCPALARLAGGFASDRDGLFSGNQCHPVDGVERLRGVLMLKSTTIVIALTILFATFELWCVRIVTAEEPWAPTFPTECWRDDCTNPRWGMSDWA